MFLNTNVNIVCPSYSTSSFTLPFLLLDRAWHLFDGSSLCVEFLLFFCLLDIENVALAGWQRAPSLFRNVQSFETFVLSGSRRQFGMVKSWKKKARYELGRDEIVKNGEGVARWLLGGHYDWQRPLDFIWDHLSIVYGVYFTNLRYLNKFQVPQRPKSIVSAPLNARNSEKIEFFDKEW